MSKIYTDLNTVLTPYATAIKKNASDITSLNGSLDKNVSDLKSALTSLYTGENRLENRLAFDASGTFSNAKMSVSVNNGLISINDNNFGSSVFLELKNPLNKITSFATATKYLTLLAGHTYKLRTIPISGTFTGIGNKIRCAICSGESSEDYSVKAEGEEVTFSYDFDTTASVVLYIAYGTTAEVVFQYSLEDVTPDTSNQNPLNITAYFGQNKIPKIDNIEASIITLTFQDANLVVYDSAGGQKNFSPSDILTAASALQSVTVDTTNKTIRGSTFRFYYDVKKHQIGFKDPYQKWGVDEVNLYTHMYYSYNSGIIYDVLVNSVTFENKNDIAEIQGESIPDYYIEQIETVSGNYRKDVEKVGRNGDSFVFITDVHWEGNWKHSPALINYLVKNEDLNMVICGGDVIDGSETYYERSAEYLRLTIDKFKNTGALVITAKGNHDKNDAYQQWSSSVHFSEEKYFGLVQKPSALNGQIYGGDCYFYYDKVSTKTRYIVLDSKTNADATYDITTEQITWIGGIIDNTPTDYHIIVVVHSMGEYQSTTNPVEAGVNDFVYKTGATSLKTLLDSKLSSHMIEALFFGHTHYDAIMYTDNGIPLISTNSDAKWQYYGMPYPADGTVDAQCFDVVTLDYQTDGNGKKHIYMRRIGRGTDRVISYGS